MRNAFCTVLGHHTRASRSCLWPLQHAGMEAVPIMALGCRLIAQFVETYPALATEVALHGNW